jgi:hypothetical protein
MNNQENQSTRTIPSSGNGRSYHKYETARNLAALPLLTTFPLRSIRRNFWFSWGKWSRKTTAMKMLIGISTPTSGEAVVAGYERY